MEPVDERTLVRELAEIALTNVAPEELAVFDETADEFFEDPDGVLSAERRDEAVGFGLDAALAAPYVLAVVVPVIHYLVSTVVEASKEESKSAITGLVRRLFRRIAPGDDTEQAPAPGQPEDPAAADKDAALSPEQASRVRSIAWQRALDLGLSEAKARLLADSVSGGLLATG